jgi:Uma2 family endonuclease
MEALSYTPTFPQAMSVEEYRELERQLPHIRFEYIDGIVYEMPGGTVKHENICSNFIRMMDRKLGDAPCQIFLSGLKLQIPDRERYFYPDVMVCCPPPEEDALSPTLVAEVLSPSTAWYDVSTKKVIYMELASLRHLLFIDPQQVFVEHNYRPDTDTAWHIECFNDLDAEIYFHSWDIRIPVRGLYRFVF